MELAVVSRGIAHFRDDMGSGDNNEAEWLALLFAMQLAVVDGARDAAFVGDSMLVVQQAKRAWPCRSEQLRPYLAMFGELSAKLPRFVLRHVPRSKNLAGIALSSRRLGL